MIKSLPEAAAARWAGIKDGRHKPYFVAAVAYERVCMRSNRAAWPVSGRTLEAFARHLGERMLPSSVDTNLQRVRTFCTACGLSYPPRSQLGGLRLVMRGQQRRAWSDVKRARPLRARHLRRLDQLMERQWSAETRRLSAMLWVSHSGLLRSIELLHLRWGDIRFFRHGVRVRILPQFSKMSLGGPGDFVWIPREGSRAYAALLGWYHECGSPADEALVWDTNGYSYSRWLRQTKEVGKALGLSGVSTHSLRAGGATDLLQGGADFETVKRAGRWASMCFLQYWRPDPAEITAQLAAAFLAADVSAKRLRVSTGESWRQHRAREQRRQRQHRVSFEDH